MLTAYYIKVKRVPLPNELDTLKMEGGPPNFFSNPIKNQFLYKMNIFCKTNLP